MRIKVKEAMFIDSNFLKVGDVINLDFKDAYYLVKIGKAIQIDVKEDIEDAVILENVDVKEEFKDIIVNKEVAIKKKINKRVVK